jgi:hypothetical protein
MEYESTINICSSRETVIEGTVYYDAKKDEAKREVVSQERNLIIGDA